MGATIIGSFKSECKRIRHVVASLIVIPVICNLVLSPEVTVYPSSFNSIRGDEFSLVKSSEPVLVIQLRGEMGNHLSSIAHGMGIHWYAEEMFNLKLQVLLRHQVLPVGPSQVDVDSPKWKPTRDTIKQCFPNLRSWTFDRGMDWTEYDSSYKDQLQWLPHLTRKNLDSINGRPWQGVMSRRDPQPVELEDWNKSLLTFQTVWRRPDRPPSKSYASLLFQRDYPVVSVPFLRSESLENTLVVNRYLENLRNLFLFDYATCCGNQSPYQDETVLHFRNFRAELADNYSGLEDVSARQTSHILLQHLKVGDKVAITTRIHNDNLQRHVNALRAKGLQVRVIEGQSAAQDFCFLLQSKKELVGNFQSTFFFWAAVLGQATTVRFYTLDSPQVRERCGGAMDIMMRRFMYNWTHPDLKDRFHQMLIPIENDELQTGQNGER